MKFARVLLMAFVGLGMLSSLQAQMDPKKLVLEEESQIPLFSAGGAYYLWSSQADFDSGVGSLQMTEAGLSLPIPLVERGGFRMWTSLRFRHNDVELTGNLPLTGDFDLYRLQMPLNALYEVDDRWTVWLRAEPGLHSDFKSISEDDFVWSAIGLALYEWTDTLRVAFGAYYSDEFGDQQLLPVAGLIWEPNPYFTVNLTFPRASIAYSPVDGTVWSVFASPGGGVWSVTNPVTGIESDLEIQNVRVGLGVQQELWGPVWGFVEGGAQLFQTVDFAQRGEQDVEEAWFGSAGIRLHF